MLDVFFRFLNLFYRVLDLFGLKKFFSLNNIIHIKDLFSLKDLFNLVFFNKIQHLDENDCFKDDAGTEKPFKPHYNKYILPLVKEFEEKRLVALQKVRHRIFISVFLCLALFLLPIDFSNDPKYFGISNKAIFVTTFDPFYIHFHSNLRALFTVFIALFFIAYVYFPIAIYHSSIKYKILPLVFTFFDFYDNSKNASSIEFLKPFGIIPKYDNIDLKYNVKGANNNVGIELIETILEQIVHTKRGREQTTVFSGIFVLFTMNKTFKGKTIIIHDLGLIVNWVKEQFSNLENIKLEDPVFEDKFQVFSTDQIEARYLLTPAFMERLLALSSMFNNKIKFSFYNNKLLLMIETAENRFKPDSIFMPSTFEYDIKTVLIEMQAIFNIIDTLKLSEKTGL